jgi:hypothetical protein
MDELTNYLTEGTKHADISSETLELMGKRAANMYLDHGVSLNEGIAKIASEYKDINHEQVKRVVEHANTSVYLAQHDMNKTAGKDSSYPQFELAEASKVLQNLSDENRTVVVTPTDISYSSRVEQKTKLSAAKNAELEKGLAEMFEVEGSEKTASLDFSVDTAINDLLLAKHSAEDNKNHFEYTYSEVLSLHKEASAEYYELVKRFMLDGGDFSHVMAAARSTELEDAKIASVMRPVVEKLMEDKVASDKQLQQSIRNLEKVAFRVINPNHPLVTNFASLAELNDEVDVVKEALSKSAEAYNIAKEAINETFFDKSSK